MGWVKRRPNRLGSHGQHENLSSSPRLCPGFVLRGAAMAVDCDDAVVGLDGLLGSCLVPSGLTGDGGWCPGIAGNPEDLQQKACTMHSWS